MEPFDVGGASAIWSAEQLTSEERAYAQRVQEAAAREGDLRDGFAEAARQLEQRALVEKAEHELGVDDLIENGVVP